MAFLSNKNVKRPFITLNANGISNAWLFDTGAAVTCMSTKEFRKIAHTSRPTKLPPMTKLISASNTPLKVRGVYNLTLTIKNHAITHPVYVCDNLHQDAILGIDAIKQLGIIFDPTNDKFAFTSTKNDWHTVADISPTMVATLHAAHACTIPPLGVQTIELRTRTHNGYEIPEKITAIANLHSPTHPLLFGGPAVVCTTQTGTVHMRVHNCSSLPLSLLRNDKLGYMESIPPSHCTPVHPQSFVEALDKVTCPPPTHPNTKRKRKFSSRFDSKCSTL